VPAVRDLLKIDRFEDLDTYQLAVELRREVFRLSSKGPVTRDYKFVTQIRDAARGGPRNISEGFSRFKPNEFVNFLSYAKASIDESKNHILDGFESGYFTREECDGMLLLVRRTLGAIRGLMRYLESPAAALAFERIRKARGVGSRRNPRTRNPEPLEP
jgi:four helix bundle protein